MSDRFRVFRIPYRQAGKIMYRCPDVSCDPIIKANYRVGELWAKNDGKHIWIHIIVDDFPRPTTEAQEEVVDQLFADCEQKADDWVRVNYPDCKIEDEPPQEETDGS